MFASSLNNPVGERVGQIITIGAGTLNLPYGYLACDGSAISRTLYKRLFDVIGESYGSGDGSTTFNLPTQSAIVDSIDSTIAIYGNGKAIGLTTGSQTASLAQVYGTSIQGLMAYKSIYDKAVGTASGSISSSAVVNSYEAIGITDNSSKSGITGEANVTASNYLFCIRY